jgi:K+-sensing histidine kinase KdpD
MTSDRLKHGSVAQLAFDKRTGIKVSDMVVLSRGGLEERMAGMKALCLRMIPIDDVHVHLVEPAASYKEGLMGKADALTSESGASDQTHVQTPDNDPFTRVRTTGDALYLDGVQAGLCPAAAGGDRLDRMAAVLLVPLKAGAGVIGVLQAGTADPEGIPERVCEDIEWLATPFALAIENALLTQRQKVPKTSPRRGNTPGRPDGDSTAMGSECQVAHLAHDMKNALTTLTTFIQLLPAKWDDMHFRTSFYPIARDETRQLRHLIHTLLVQGQNRSAPRVPVDIRALVESLVASKAPLAAQRNVQLKTRLATASTVTRLDESKIREALTNLIHNALEATPDAGVITIRLEDLVLSGGRPAVRLEIQDSGPGIDIEMQASLFEPYTSTKTGDHLTRGTGLGLFIAHRHIQAHGGTIEVESPKDSGALFRVILPLERRCA